MSSEFDGSELPNEEEVFMNIFMDSVLPLYKGFKDHGLSIQEAAALTAAFVSHALPQQLKGPVDGS